MVAVRVVLARRDQLEHRQMRPRRRRRAATKVSQRQRNFLFYSIYLTFVINYFYCALLSLELKFPTCSPDTRGASNCETAALVGR